MVVKYKFIRKSKRKCSTKYQIQLLTIILFILLIINMASISSASITPLNQKIINENDKEELKKITFFRTYVVGKIYNLTIENDSYDFQSDNLRVFDVFRDYFGTWGLSYAHWFEKNMYFSYHGFSFRGILKPTFICGFFYI